MAKHIQHPIASFVTVLGIWKMVLVLFISTPDSPLGMMIGEFPEIYLGKAACVKAIPGFDEQMVKDTKDLAAAGRFHEYVLYCIESLKGQGA